MGENLEIPVGLAPVNHLVQMTSVAKQIRSAPGSFNARKPNALLKALYTVAAPKLGGHCQCETPFNSPDGLLTSSVVQSAGERHAP